VWCPCGDVVAHWEVLQHESGRASSSGGCPCFEAGPLLPAWDDNLRC